MQKSLCTAAHQKVRHIFSITLVFNSEPSGWHKDGINNGRIILTKDGDNWDILFGDAAGSSGYRSDGATVILLAWTDEFIRLGAFANNYSDVYNFNLKEQECSLDIK